MPEISTPETPPENEQDNNSPDRRSKQNERGQARENRNQPRDTEAERGRSDPTRNIAEDTNRRVRSQIPRDVMAKPTPWQKARNLTRSPLKKAAKIGLFVANPVAYSAVYAADWLAQRTPGVKNLYSTPREIIRSTADRSMNVLNGAATFVPALPFTVAHEISDKVSGLDVSKPTTLVGNLIDKVGDVVGGAFNITKTGVEKLYKLTKEVGVPAGKLLGSAIAAPFKLTFGTIGQMYKGIGKIGGFTGFIGQLALTVALGVGSHTLIMTALPAISPGAVIAYQAALDYIGGIIGFL